MSGPYLGPGLYPRELLRPAAEYIARVQLPSGEIPWFPGGHTDPWDHVEAAMGLSIAGATAAAERAYGWLADRQLEDGSWWACYRDGAPEEPDRRESNFVAYCATGVWHHFLVTQDRPFLDRFWPMVDRAMGFILGLQSPHGDVAWAVGADGIARDDALVTGCSSIYKSLECAHNIAVLLGHERRHWLGGRQRLGEALRHRPERFDRGWESKARFSMDWFYPVLCGAITGRSAQQRLHARWETFVEPMLGCRCVSDKPWVTVAESCELVMALLGAGDHARAVEVYSWLHQWRAEDGAFWTGYEFAEGVLWPEERPTWTAAAMLLAADALTQHTRASRLFTTVELLQESPGMVGDSGRATQL